MYESIKMDMRRLQVDYQFLGRQIQMKNHQNLILVKMQLEKNNENDIERILDDSMQTRGITTYVKNGSAQKYGKEYSPKSGDKFVLSVAKGETVVLTKEITKSSKYKIESGVALEVGSITQGLASSMTAKYTKSTKYTGPTTKGTNTREYRVKFYRHKRKQIEYRKITNTKLKEVNIIFSIPSKYLKYNIDKKVK